MKRDMDLIRNILHYIDASEDEDAISGRDIDGYSHEVIAWHVLLMKDAGIVRAKMVCDAGSKNPDDYEIYSITREGYEFLDAFSNDALWKKAQGMIGDIGDAPIHLVIPLFMELIKARVI